ncbi:hypothetical protein CDO52_00630 [Nocardiopsis gilva YIM 90087]|uniref:Uncharacterized protein n=2 Tax=Nocardiopsis gilva TaxID=280236 RepID=A0A223S046_9ACTN|nr:hypothetical protein CDO52_00630 [Nocardiopsis gilva YIM 90087]
MASVIRVTEDDISVTYDPRLPLIQRFTIRGTGGRIVRLRAPYWEAHRALMRECKMSYAQASNILAQAAGVDS